MFSEYLFGGTGSIKTLCCEDPKLAPCIKTVRREMKNNIKIHVKQVINSFSTIVSPSEKGFQEESVSWVPHDDRTTAYKQMFRKAV